MDERLLRTKKAHKYLAMDRKVFDVCVRPFISFIRIGRQGIAFDRLDLDRWIEDHKERSEHPINDGGHTSWDAKKCQGSITGMGSGTLTRKSSDGDFMRALAQVTSMKRQTS